MIEMNLKYLMMMNNKTDITLKPASGGSGEEMAKRSKEQQQNSLVQSYPVEIPSITLPKGGGALKGIDEKFQVNAANGTSSFSMPLPFSKSRNDFGPSLSLEYNSGMGNSSFGLGWSCDVPSLQRKTDKKLPQYNDEKDSDVFIFSGVEDLVPYLERLVLGCMVLPVIKVPLRFWHIPILNYMTLGVGFVINWELKGRIILFIFQYMNIKQQPGNILRDTDQDWKEPF